MPNLLEQMRTKTDKETLLNRANEIKAQIDKHETEIAGFRLEIVSREDKIAKLKGDPDYLPDVKLRELQREVTKAAQLIAAVQTALSIEDQPQQVPDSPCRECPVCLEQPRQIFACVICENWVCQKCRLQLARCPICRQDLEEKPLVRNKLAEKFYHVSTRSVD